MSDRKQRIIEVLAERIGWVIAPHPRVKDHQLWTNPNGIHAPWPVEIGRPAFNPYESEADCAALVDWMIEQGWYFGIESSVFHATKDAGNIEFISPSGEDDHSYTIHTWSDRKTAITECAAEALGIEVSDDE